MVRVCLALPSSCSVCMYPDRSVVLCLCVIGSASCLSSDLSLLLCVCAVMMCVSGTSLTLRSCTCRCRSCCHWCAAAAAIAAAAHFFFAAAADAVLCCV